MVVGGEEENSLARLQPVGEGGAFLHQHLVHDGWVSDEDDRAAGDGDGDHGPWWDQSCLSIGMTSSKDLLSKK